MLKTTLSDLLGVELPIIQAGMGPFGSGAELAAAVSNAGGLGTVGAAGRSIADLQSQLRRIKELTSRPYAVNLTLPALTDENFAAILGARPPVFSLALGDPGDLVKRAHEAGIRFVQQVHTVQQARLAAERGVDVIVAQGGEAGGFTGLVAALVLVPQVVDAVRPIPVVAAGGIADGRGLAAALTLGAKGIQMGTRFLASNEASVSDDWKQAIVAAESEDAVKADVWRDIFPAVPVGAFDVVPRALRTRFIEEWQERGDDARGNMERLQQEIGAAVQQGRMYDKVPFTGQTAGMIREILPVAEIMRRMVAEAQEALQTSKALVG